MVKEEDIKTALVQSAIEYVRQNHQEAIDKAYEYFWDEENPDEFLTGTALELGFINFEDWLMFDFKANEDKETFLEIYCREQSPAEKNVEIAGRLSDSVISLYEVTSVAKDKRVMLKDLLLGEEYSLRNKTLTRGLSKGDIFATRLLNLDGNCVMSVCVYPFSRDQKTRVVESVGKQFRRYIKNANPRGTMKDYLKDFGDVFNLIWMSLFARPDKECKR